MNRRELLAAGVIGPIAADELIRAGFTAALRGRQAEEQWRERIAEYGRDYMAVGAETLQRRLAADLVALQQQLETPGMWATAARAHVAAGRGDLDGAVAADEAARRVFDRVASPDSEVSDFAVPPWRMATFRSMLYARLGLTGPGSDAQDEADRCRPATLTRFATHIELHRALMMAKAGDRVGGVAYARRAWAALPAERRSQTLRLVFQEVERAGRAPRSRSTATP